MSVINVMLYITILLVCAIFIKQNVHLLFYLLKANPRNGVWIRELNYETDALTLKTLSAEMGAMNVAGCSFEITWALVVTFIDCGYNSKVKDKDMVSDTILLSPLVIHTTSYAYTLTWMSNRTLWHVSLKEWDDWLLSLVDGSNRMQPILSSSRTSFGTNSCHSHCVH